MRLEVITSMISSRNTYLLERIPSVTLKNVPFIENSPMPGLMHTGRSNELYQRIRR